MDMSFSSSRSSRSCSSSTSYPIGQEAAFAALDDQSKHEAAEAAFAGYDLGYPVHDESSWDTSDADVWTRIVYGRNGVDIAVCHVHVRFVPGTCSVREVVAFDMATGEAIGNFQA